MRTGLNAACERGLHPSVRIGAFPVILEHLARLGIHTNLLGDAAATDIEGVAKSASPLLPLELLRDDLAVEGL